MINKMLLNMMTAITLFLSVNIQSDLSKQLDSTHSVETGSTLGFDSRIKIIFKSLHNNWNGKIDKPPVSAGRNDEKNNMENINTEEYVGKKTETMEETFEKWKESFPKYPENSKQVHFIQTIAPAAVLIANKYDIYPSVMIAQAALESSWGQSELATLHNNLMGTKGTWNGESITARTREDINGESIYIQAGFSVYDSWGASLYRYGHLMRNGLNWDSKYYQGTWRKNAGSYSEATAWLQGRYATDSSYAKKLNQTIQSFNLDQYDTIESLDMNLEELLTKLNIQHEESL